MKFEIGRTGWQIGDCDSTNDFCLIVNRGIPCEDHTQVISRHVTNKPSESTIRDYLFDSSAELSFAINSFTAHAAAADACGLSYNYIDQIGITFLHALLGKILSDCENLENNDDYTAKSLVQMGLDSPA